MSTPHSSAGVAASSLGTSATKAPRFRIGDGPPPVLLLIQTLDLATVLLCLLGCLLAYGETPTVGYAIIAAIAAALSGKMLTAPDLEGVLNYGSIPSRQVTRVVVEWSGVCGVLLLLAFALKVGELYSRAVVLTWFASTAMALVVTQEIQVQLARWLNRRGVVASSHVIVGAGTAGLELARHLPQAAFKGFFDFRSPERLPEAVALGQFRGRCSELGDYVRRENVQLVYITLPISKSQRIRDLLDDLRDTTASVYFVPDIFGVDLIQAKVVDLNGIPALAICDTPLSGSNAWSKRLIDLALAGAGVVILSPLLLLVAVAVRLDTRGPALFRQTRYGLNGESFLVYKFRTMTVREDGGHVVQARPGDQRVTRVGKWLRRTSLDELPQLFNVLRGSMSLVGPRPHAVVHNELYRRQISGYMVRHKVRPGITGWAQVHGLRGETDTIDKMEARVRYDLEYLSNWSLVLDFKILVKTLFVVLGQKNAY